MALPVDDETFCARLLERDDTVDAHAAYARFMAQGERRPLWRRYPAGFALVAAAFAIALLFTPLGIYARDFLTIFEPKTVTPIDVSSISGMHQLKLDLQDFGTVRTQQMRLTRVQSPGALDAAAGYHVLRPSYLPADLPSAMTMKVSHGTTQAFTFSASRARATATRLHKTLPPMPATLDGTTVTLAFGPVVEQRYGSDGHEPALVIEQMPAPVARSSGASLATLERYLLAMPGVSPEVAAQIRAIGDPESTLPVPFRGDKQNAQQITIRGVDAVAIGDNTGVGAAVLWQSHGMLYIVGGTQREDEIRKIVDGLH